MGVGEDEDDKEVLDSTPVIEIDRFTRVPEERVDPVRAFLRIVGVGEKKAGAKRDPLGLFNPLVPHIKADEDAEDDDDIDDDINEEEAVPSD